MRISTLQPGLLVSLNTRMSGNVKYTVVPIEDATIEGTSTAKWQTERVIADVAEHTAAAKARSKARQIVSSICSKSSFGLLCPESKADILTAAIADARAVADAFNATAKLTRISINVIAGRIAADDVEAVRAINAEVRSLLDDMANGVTKLDPAAIREAASAARDIGKMLNPAMQERLQVAIDAVRAQARDFVKAGETAAKIVDQSVLNRLSAVRSGFLDFDDTGKQVELPLLGRAMDLEPETQWPSNLLPIEAIEAYEELESGVELTKAISDVLAEDGPGPIKATRAGLVERDSEVIDLGLSSEAPAARAIEY